MMAKTTAQVRMVEDLNFGWKFHNGDVAGAAQTTFDDSQWRTVNVPHDFLIEQAWVAPAPDEQADNNDPAANIKSRLSSRGFKEMGKAWYRYRLTPSDSLKGRRLLLDFGGIMYVGDVYLNGIRVGGTDYGYVGFQIDVTDKLRFGVENVIAVLADTREPNNSRWYTGGGLFRNVRLIATDRELYFERHPLYITTRNNQFVTISAEFTNRGRNKSVTIGIQVYDPDGKLVYDEKVKKPRKTPSRTMEACLPEIEIPAPQLWDTEHPRLYKAVVTLLREDGSISDQTSSTFGIRTVEFSPTFGMKLNGKKVLLKGYANHHTLGALGAAAYPRAIEKRLRLMKQLGFNHVRTSHNPYSNDLYRLCDELGLLVVDELYDKWTKQFAGGRADWQTQWQKDIPEWVRRDRNHPSVVLWSLGNELQQMADLPFNDWGVTAYKLQRALLMRYDSTRLVTVAMHPRYRDLTTDSLPAPLARTTDVQAYNYRYMYFPGDRRRFPWMTFYQSEANMTGLPGNYYGMELDKVIGLAYWGAISYFGESRGWPLKGWDDSFVDISLQPKPLAGLIKSMFRPDEPLVQIAIVDRAADGTEWNGIKFSNDQTSAHWVRKTGERLKLYTYTNADEVELIVNGRSIGRQRNPKDDPKHRNVIVWRTWNTSPATSRPVAITARSGSASSAWRRRDGWPS